MSQRLLETDFPSAAYKPQIRRSSSRERPPNLSLRPLSTSGGTMPKNYSSSASEWQYEPSLINSRTGSMSRVQTSFAVKQPQRTEAIVTRTGSLRKAFTNTTSDEDEEETRPLHRPHNNHNTSVTSNTVTSVKTHGNNSQSSTSDYHSDENPNLLPVEHRELPSFRLNQLHSRHRKSDDDEMSGGARCCFGFLTFIAQILLHGVLGLVFFWIVKYHSKENKPWPFSWRVDPDLEWNLHPVLMITGFIYFMGQAMLMYRTCRCCRRIWSKLLHTMFHLLAAPCIAIGFVAVWEFHENRKVSEGGQEVPAPIPHFYSLHSWMGLTTMGLFALQFVVGFFSFLLLLCCESATASFRAALVPIHSTFGITTFVMAVATACSGLTEKAFFTLSVGYSKWVPFLMDSNFDPNQTDLTRLDKFKDGYKDKHFEESMVINVLGAALVGLVIVMPILVLHPKFRFRPQRIITVTHDRYG